MAGFNGVNAYAQAHHGQPGFTNLVEMRNWWVAHKTMPGYSDALNTFNYIAAYVVPGGGTPVTPGDSGGVGDAGDGGGGAGGGGDGGI